MLLKAVSPQLERLLAQNGQTEALFGISQLRYETIRVTTRDGISLATDLYLPPVRSAPAILVRTPYGRAMDAFVGTFVFFARRGYAVVSQDCRGTGDSEPSAWDYYVYEREDSFDLVDWVTKQSWFGGFLAGCGGSYLGQTQWCMAMHPRMSAIAPVMSGLGIAIRTVSKHLFYNAYARTVGKGKDKASLHYSEMERLLLKDTLAGGFFNDPLQDPLPDSLLVQYPELRALNLGEARRSLWQQYCNLPAAQRAEFIKCAVGGDRITITSIEALSSIFGHTVGHDGHMFPSIRPSDLCRSIHAPALMVTGWYDWSLNDALATWALLRREGQECVRARLRLIITPSAHNAPGYHEGIESHAELQKPPSLPNVSDLLLHWYAAVRDSATDDWPTVIYYLMGANEWHVASDWPPANAQSLVLYLGAEGTLGSEMPRESSATDGYTYDPTDPTPTVGGSIVSYVYPPGSVDVSGVQRRADVVSYTTAALEYDLDVVGPLQLILYASSSAADTDFCARLSDVFPDGRAIQLQTGIVRARYREPHEEPQLLEPGRIYRFQIDMWATANRFRARHRLRLDVSSSDFPRFDRNANLGGGAEPPVAAVQAIFHDAEHPSHLIVSVLIERGAETDR